MPPRDLEHFKQVAEAYPHPEFNVLANRFGCCLYGHRRSLFGRNAIRWARFPQAVLQQGPHTGRYLAAASVHRTHVTANFWSVAYSACFERSWRSRTTKSGQRPELFSRICHAML
mmetsp:Transcript_56225/g.146581  ORF Transcript_56225/g.146581 Transcript_56225/m.146581 type:complete len:115 (-) Transcript_56225:37-381(-)